MGVQRQHSRVRRGQEEALPRYKAVLLARIRCIQCKSSRYRQSRVTSKELVHPDFREDLRCLMVGMKEVKKWQVPGESSTGWATAQANRILCHQAP